MSEEKVVKTGMREQVKALIDQGDLTKAEIAEQLEVKPGSVSSQMTYLRWMGNFIISDPETKILSFVTEDEYNEFEAAKAAKRSTKTSTSSKDPQTQANDLAKTIARQEKQLEKFEARVEALREDDGGDEDALAEAEANATLLRIKLTRNNAKAEQLPEPAEEEEVAQAEGDEEDLL